MDGWCKDWDIANPEFTHYLFHSAWSVLKIIMVRLGLFDRLLLLFRKMTEQSSFYNFWSGGGRGGFRGVHPWSKLVFFYSDSVKSLHAIKMCLLPCNNVKVLLAMRTFTHNCMYLFDNVKWTFVHSSCKFWSKGTGNCEMSAVHLPFCFGQW